MTIAMTTVPKCSVGPCTRAATVKGWCHAHWCRWQRSGDPGDAPIRSDFHTRTVEERFWSKVDKTESGCWLWTGAKINGYGTFRDENSKNIYVHRWAWQQVNGPIPKGLTLDHVLSRGCTSKACVRVDHLEVVTYGENTRRGSSPPGIAQRLNVCKRGHSDWYTFPGGRRRCRVCQRASERTWREARKG